MCHVTPQALPRTTRFNLSQIKTHTTPPPPPQTQPRIQSMEDYHQPISGEHHQLSIKTVLCVSLATVAVAGPLVSMMGFSFLASVTVLLITSPLLLIFSPLLFGAGFALVGALAGFGVAAAMALAGVSSLAWIVQEVRGHVGFGGGAVEKLEEAAGERVKEQGGFLEQNVQEYSPEDKVINGD